MLDRAWIHQSLKQQQGDALQGPVDAVEQQKAALQKQEVNVEVLEATVVVQED